MSNTFEIGQTVFYTDNDRKGRIYPSKVESIGRKWVNLEKHAGRFDKETMLLDGGQYSSPGKVYLSEEVYRNELAVEDLWKKFREAYTYRAPEGVTVDNIREAARLLKLEIKS